MAMVGGRAPAGPPVIAAQLRGPTGAGAIQMRTRDTGAGSTPAPGTTYLLGLALACSANSMPASMPLAMDLARREERSSA